jgi:hypothetical protein
MKNSVNCKNCSAENPLYNHICSKCKYYIRDKIPNIDIWETIGLIIESPSKAFQRIIFSEHKNFVVFLTLFFALRILIVTRFISLIEGNFTSSTTPIILSYILVLLGLTLVLITFFVLISFTLTKMDYRIRIKDLYSVYMYSSMLNIFSVVILFPIQLIVFGDYLFSNNPDPFQVKPILAYILTGFEIGIVIWSLILNYISFKVLTCNNAAGFIIMLLLNVILAGLIYLASQYVFYL